MEIHKIFNAICEFKQASTTFNNLISSERQLNRKYILDDLNSLKRDLEILFSERFKQNFKVKISRGYGSLPRVLYVCILPENQIVSNGIYAVICFDIYGGGALAGCAESKIVSQGLKTVQRSSESPLKIDVNGASESTKYNDNFVNPREFCYPLSDDGELISHLTESFRLALEAIKDFEINRF